MGVPHAGLVVLCPHCRPHAHTHTHTHTHHRYKVRALNELLANLWPSLRESVESTSVNPMVLSMLKAALGDALVADFELFLGANPPVILGIKHYSRTGRGKDVMIDLLCQTDGDTSGTCTKSQRPTSSWGNLKRVGALLLPLFAHLRVRCTRVGGRCIVRADEHNEIPPSGRRSLR